MHKLRSIAVCVVMLSAAGLVPKHLRAAESYDSCTGYIDRLPATITTQGVWCLRKDLSTEQTSGRAITIAAHNVTIDCNGFKIGGLAAGNASLTTAINSVGRNGITVRRCNVRGFLRGVQLTGGVGHLVEDNRLDNNLMVGILVHDGDGNVIRHNRVYDSGGHSAINVGSYGIIAANSDIVDNIVDGVFSSQPNGFLVGIELNGSAGHVVRGNIVRNLAAKPGDAVYGIRVLNAPGNRVLGNHVVTAPATAGIGIQGATNSSQLSLRPLCGGNTVGGFATAYANCQDIGNYTY